MTKTKQAKGAVGLQAREGAVNARRAAARRVHPLYEYNAKLAPLLTRVATVEQQLKWLANFARLDLRQPGLGEDARWEAQAFCDASTERTWSGTNRIVTVGGEHSAPDVLSRRDLADPAIWRPFEPDFSLQDLAMLQMEIRKCFEFLAKPGHGYCFPRPLFNGVVSDGKRGIRLVNEGEARPRFMASVVTLLLEVNTSLGFCAADSCRSPFMRKRPWQRYCKVRCENRAAVARRRKKLKKTDPAKLSEDRRNTYIRAQQRRYPGQKLRVARQRRQKTSM
jgi:hypothetical protein